MSSAARSPQTSEELRAAILDSYEDLSKRLQQIARYVLDEPNAVALETLAVIGERAGVQPSAIVRFAKAIGFESRWPCGLSHLPLGRRSPCEEGVSGRIAFRNL